MSRLCASVPMRQRPRPLESSHRQCLRAVCGDFRLSQGCSCRAFGWHPQAPFLHHRFSQTVSSVSLPGHGGRVGKRDSVTTAHPSDGG